MGRGGETARWTSMLSVLVQSKVPILMCIELAASAVQLPENSSRLKSVGNDVRRGKRFSSAIEDQRLLEGTSLTMLKVGENRGNLVPCLDIQGLHRRQASCFAAADGGSDRTDQHSCNRVGVGRYHGRRRYGDDQSY